MAGVLPPPHQAATLDLPASIEQLPVPEAGDQDGLRSALSAWLLSHGLQPQAAVLLNLLRQEEGQGAGMPAHADADAAVKLEASAQLSRAAAQLGMAVWSRQVAGGGDRSGMWGCGIWPGSEICFPP